MKKDPIIIDINDDDRPDDRPVDTPVFSLESTESSAFENNKPRKRGYWGWLMAAFLGLILGASLIRHFSTGPAEPDFEGLNSSYSNIAALQSPFSPSSKGTMEQADSILGVKLEMYSLSGLKASLEPNLPDTADKSLVLFMRSADYHSDNTMIGRVVTDGEKLPSKEKSARKGYVAISNSGKPVVGISSSDDVSDYTEKNGGSFFRQYPLLVNGILPSTFELHGKVERAAIAVMPDGKLFYVIAPHKETMYDFADALREYGFADAVYITGGNNYSFYRTPDGVSHHKPELIPKLEKYACTPPPSPFLVFRNK